MAKGRVDNLKPFQKGVSGNPGGRPKKRPITDHYFELSEKPVPEVVIAKFNRYFGKELLKAGATWAQATALRMFLEAVLRGNVQAAREIREAIEGKSPQRLEISGPERKQITIRVLHDRSLPIQASEHDENDSVAS